ncbi:MAG: hypothetical protein K2G24_01005 [Muribaculaceae bacterium]|nr:hypothetical protein [Muribaculaceae bacterium]
MNGIFLTNDSISYLIAGLFLLLFETLYVHFARKFNINDKPSLRSSHRVEIPTGGGVVIFMSVLIFILWHTYMANVTWWTLLLSCGVLTIVSYIDDLNPLPAESRLMIQVVVIAYVFRTLIHLETFDIFLIILILGTGLVNAYNFMDGINGMLVAYSTVFLGTIAVYISVYGPSPTATYAPTMFIGLTISLLVAVLILGIFNFRTKALIFSGDVGSITMGYCVMFIMASTIIHTGNATIIVFLIVYAVDSVYTILQRLFEGERITLPHRKHLYQVLVHRRGYSHLAVSTGYAVTQLVINSVYFLIPATLQWTYVIVVLTSLTFTYFILKH